MAEVDPGGAAGAARCLFSVPASTLIDPVTAAWVRAHGTAVHAWTDDDLDFLSAAGVSPDRVVLRCGSTTDPIERAIAHGVVQFIVATPRHVDVVAERAHSRSFVYLDERAPAVFGESRLQVVGLHADVDTLPVTSSGAVPPNACYAASR